MSKIKFIINYDTNFGEELYICASFKESLNIVTKEAIKMNYQHGSWTLSLELNASGMFQYSYLVKKDNKVIRQEWGKPRTLYITNAKNFTINDRWKEDPQHSYLFTSPFSNSIFFHKTTNKAARYPHNSIVINVICPFAKREEHLVISGDSDHLGNWDISKAQPLHFIGNGVWQAIFNSKMLPKQSEYKLVIVDSKTNKPTYWEYGDNRVLTIDDAEQDSSVQVEMALQFNYHSFSFKGSGTSIPVFSLRSNDSFGIGDFNDLKMIVDWAEITNQQIIQVLPINDTTTTKTWFDSYPYNAISSYALHPMYLGLRQFTLKDKIQQKSLRKEARELNKLKFLDYEKVFKLKDKYTRILFDENKEMIFKSNEFKEFYQNNISWLFPYSIYCYLRDKHNTAHFPDWGDNAIYDKDKLTSLLDNNSDAKESFDYYCYLQFLLDKQLKEVTQYAHSRGVTLKGDIPIGINRDSIEAWTAPHLFNMDTQTGAPPDDFSIYGQNWGFPTYNWDAMKHDNFDWWKRRFQKMADYFDAYRIDHILGFFRIWEIPTHSVQGLLGHFSPALPYSKDDIIYASIPFDEERMTKPFIHEEFLHDIFGTYTKEVEENYLEVSGWKLFKLKSDFDTQVKIRNHFHNKNDDKGIVIRDGLYQLCNEVLFVQDRTNSDLFHPRITAYTTYSYKHLQEHERYAFDNLYEDFFYHRHNQYWSKQAMTKLPTLITSTNMLCCGEDLGMVPNCLPHVMSKLKILSLEIERMPKSTKVEFTKLTNIPYLSVSTTSTHDMSPIRLWWTEDKDITQRYYNQVLQHAGAAPDECSPELCMEIINHHLQSSAMWVILPWQDWMSISTKLAHTNPSDERINIPSEPNHYWRWRMHITLEELLKQTDLNKTIKDISKR